MCTFPQTTPLPQPAALARISCLPSCLISSSFNILTLSLDNKLFKCLLFIIPFFHNAQYRVRCYGKKKISPYSSKEKEGNNIWVYIPALALTSYGILGMFFNFSVKQFPHL